MPAALVHPQQAGDRQAAHPADDENVQPAVVGLSLGGCIKAASIGAAIADGTHQAVHRQLLAVDGEGHVPADVAAELLDDGECIGHLAAAERDAPELRDAVSHLRIEPGGADGRRKAEVGLHQINVHLAARQLGVEVIELFPRAVGAQKIIAAAKGQAPHRCEAAPLRPCQRLVEGAVAARCPDAHRLTVGLRGVRRLSSQLPGMARVLGHNDLPFFRRDARPLGCGLDGRGQLGSAVPLACGGIEQKQIAHSASSSGGFCPLS